MEIKILEEKKNRIIISVEGVTHTLLNALKEELANDDNVKSVGYNIKHPLVAIPQLIVETDGADVRKVISSAVNRLDKSAEKIKKEASKVK